MLQHVITCCTGVEKTTVENSQFYGILNWELFSPVLSRKFIFIEFLRSSSKISVKNFDQIFKFWPEIEIMD